MPFIDTVTLFSAFFEGEKHHEQAKRILQAIAGKKVVHAIFSDYVLDELLTLARKKKSPYASNTVLENILNSEIELVKVEHRHLAVACDVFKKYPKLSFTDATSIAIMMDRNMKEIYSFDADFDSMPKIIRLEDFTVEEK